MSRVVTYIIAVALILKVGTAAPAESAQGSNNHNVLVNISTVDAFKQLWKGFRAVDYLVVSDLVTWTCIIYRYLQYITASYMTIMTYNHGIGEAFKYVKGVNIYVQVSI